MRTSQTPGTTAEDTARHMFQAAGYRTARVPAAQRRHGEFLTLTFADPRGTAQALSLIARPGSHVEVERVHAGRAATRLYLRWATGQER